VLPPLRCRRHAVHRRHRRAAADLTLPRCRHRRCCRCCSAIRWLLRCCPPSDIVIACRHATINALVAGRFH
jgi:hypothetical protein